MGGDPHTNWAGTKAKEGKSEMRGDEWVLELEHPQKWRGELRGTEVHEILEHF